MNEVRVCTGEQGVVIVMESRWRTALARDDASVSTADTIQSLPNLYARQSTVKSTQSVYKSVVTTFDPGSAFTSIVGPIPAVSNFKSLIKRSAAAA